MLVKHFLLTWDPIFVIYQLSFNENPIGSNSFGGCEHYLEKKHPFFHWKIGFKQQCTDFTTRQPGIYPEDFTSIESNS